MKEPRSEVHNCDCVEFMRTLPDNYFDLAIADPPYSYAGNDDFAKRKRFNKGRFWRYRNVDGQDIDIDAWDKAPSDEFFDEMFRVSKNQIIWGANYFDGMPATKCFIIWKKQIPENFSMAMCEYAWTSFDRPAKMFRQHVASNGETKIHPCQKSVALYAWILKYYANDGETIFDPMVGSGSSRIAAYKMGFDYVGCELDKDYFDAQERRFAEECFGEMQMGNGETVKQLTLF